MRRTATALIVGAAAIAAVTVVIAALKPLVDPHGLAGLYLFAILPVPIGWGFVIAGVVAVASFLTFAFFFSSPAYSFQIGDSDNAAALLIALVTAYIVSALARRAHERAAEARQRAVALGYVPDGQAQAVAAGSESIPSLGRRSRTMWSCGS